MPRTLAQWLDYQASLSTKPIQLGLERVADVWRALAAPMPAPRVITVAGTNGKGSSVAFLESMLTAAAYRTGSYTSPHLLHYNERVRIDSKPVSDEMLCDAFERIERARVDTHLTYFEFGTLAALWCMAKSGLDVAILEVGLGGRLDAVNIVDADVGLISAIGLDHTDWLGDDIEQIGAEKAGIARRDRPLVYAARAMPDAIAKVSEKVGARLYRLGHDYDYQRDPEGWRWQFGKNRRSGLPLPGMRGTIQLQNAAGALAALQLLDGVTVDQMAVRKGLLKARVAGRFDVRQRTARWILDVAHNPQAAKVLMQQLQDLYVPGTRHAVVGMLGDKAIGEVLRMLSPHVDQWHLLDLSDQPRGAGAQDLLQQLPSEARERAQLTHSVDECLSGLDRATQAQDQVLVFGSFLTVGAAMAWLESAEPI